MTFSRSLTPVLRETGHPAAVRSQTDAAEPRHLCRSEHVRARCGGTSLCRKRSSNASYVELHEEDRRERIDEDHDEDRLHDARRRVLADRFCTAFHLEALETADCRDQEREQRRLAHADPEMPRVRS